ncbi:hypothetical protein SNOG_00210 [Parastagonospora nodorum SN15]|uniref:Uncharacterized protein n=1 Tax=Phaeosphaeria nodorum (strain SN15 / ATCC MYA-4574 / FGSC 10173) TaxID=321614 RepID=Q0V704_PHANO|nr:hypothetical protein SNOG_00210 [Parastagonospora nodorum SN15]EAT91705.1 hypothetical protein SNOG_00210 [Parastagonospora nodorum SN15]
MGCYASRNQILAPDSGNPTVFKDPLRSRPPLHPIGGCLTCYVPIPHVVPEVCQLHINPMLTAKRRVSSVSLPQNTERRSWLMKLNAVEMGTMAFASFAT